MSGVAYLHAEGTGQELLVLDATRRLYIGLSRDHSYWHAVMPITIDDPRVGDGKRQAGQLTCTCIHGRIKGWCYRVGQAEAFEAGLAQSQAWIDTAAPGELVEAFGR